MTRPVLLAVDEHTRGLTPDDRVLQSAIERLGGVATPVVWGARVPPDALVVVRSTWDYVERIDEFRGWLDHLDEVGATVHNPTSLLRWNLNKRYLVELAAAGHPVVPSELISAAEPWSLVETAERFGTANLVLKPVVGASAHRVTRIGPDDTHQVDRLLGDGDVLVQPFVPSVTTDGEVSAVVIDGEVTHAARKVPATGDWRVQSELGGRAFSIPPTDAHRRLARDVLASLPHPATYARVDIVDHEGGAALMELEVIEPELYFRSAPHAAERLAERLLGGP